MDKNNALIFLDEQTDFTGEIKASDIILYGKISGTIWAEDSIRLKSGSYMEGEVYTKDFFPEKGAVYNGKLHIIKSESQNDTTKKSQPKQSGLNFRTGLQKIFSILSSWAL
ncbi:hypothetical protein CK503_03790 [Aliifodinibius salipaludis]|uniref:Polymer-forming cytoskeletal protein n=1 Tax=Fodinibius salipaludis TaxID=2032627 RepID=A0A2A2GCD1_9BACT|nr:polymer-forming cytoskeletal protein [Aliifodinibius salipaludis]PAU95326.1 hypothetical protein CK503_03790 [Aliifodinibius salipaludis]